MALGYLLFINSYSTKELKGTKEYSRFKFKSVAMWSLVMYSNCFEIASTVAFLVSQTRNMFVCNTVILYDYTRYNIHSAWFLDIRILTCLKLKCMFN